MADDYGSTVGSNTGTVTVGGSANGAIEAGADRDWFRITLVAGQSYIFNLDRGTLADPFLILRDQNGIDIVGNDDIVTNTNFNSQIRFTATVSGTYYLEAFSSDGADVGTYTVRAAIDPSPPASNDDYGSQAGSPNVGNLTVGGTVSGNLETINDRDWFAITLTAGTSYTFRQNAGSLTDPFLRLRDGNGVSLAGNDDGGGGFNSLINFTPTVTGVYYLEANTADAGQPAGIGTYTVSAVVNGNPPPAPADDFGSQVGAGNLGSVAVGSSTTGLINYGGDHDWFAVTLSAGSIYRIRQEAGTLADPRFTLRSSIGTTLTGDDDSGGGQNAQVDYTATSSGVYYIDANSADGTGTGTYTVRVTLVYGAPVIVNNTGSTVLEGGSDTITSSELSTTDPDSAAGVIFYTLTSLATNGTLTRSGSAIALNGTFTQADIDLNLIRYVHNGSETTSGSFGFSVTDGTTTLANRTFAITVTPTNDAPVVDLNGAAAGVNNTASYTEQAPVITLASGITISDVDSANLTGATVRITAGFVPLAGDGADYLGINGSGSGTVNGITYSYSATSGVLSLSGNASLAAYQAVLAQVTFQSTTNNPGTSRTVSWTVNDGALPSATATTTIAITPVDDLPVTNVPGAQNGTEDTNLVFSTANGNALTVTDFDSPTTYVAVLVNNGTLTLSQTTGLTFVGGANGSSTIVVTGTVANINAALNGLIYRGNLNYEGTDTLRFQASRDGQALDDQDLVAITLADDGRITGNAGNNTLSGTAAVDVFDLSQGGNDTVSGLGGDDGFYFGGAYTSADVVDGGAGSNDQLGLQGNYAGVTLGSLTGVELIVLLPGNDTRFGDTANNFYDYNITATDASVAAGQMLSIQANTLRVGEDLTFNGAQELDGSFLIYAGLGTDNLTGGAGNDGFFFGQGRFGASDVVNGGAGTMDQLGLQGQFTTTFGAGQLIGLEYIVLLSASDNRFGSVGGTVGYDLTMNDGNVAAGQTMIIQANTLTATETLTFNGSAESNGSFRIFSGAGNDSLFASQSGDIIFGGAGTDVLTGRGGADQLTGGSGNDRFDYYLATDSTAADRDQILDFATGDKIDLVNLAANSGGSFTFIGAGNQSSARQLQVIQTGNQATVNVFVDADNVADLVIDVTVADGHTLTLDDFNGAIAQAAEAIPFAGGGSPLASSMAMQDYSFRSLDDGLHGWRVDDAQLAHLTADLLI